MTRGTDIGSRDSDERLFEEASEWFLRLRAADPASDVHAQLEAWCAQHPMHESTYRKVVAAWETVGANAAAPEFLVVRRDALERGRRAARGRWNDSARHRRWAGWTAGLAATAACLVLLVSVRSWQARDRVQVYETAVGETRALTLPDNSRVTLDAESRVTVAYSADIRLVELSEGQAQFDVAKDPRRLFKVKVGNETVIAHGTAFNIEQRDDQVSVTLIEGRITVTEGEHAPAAAQPDLSAAVRAVVATHELAPGQQLIIKKNGQVETRRNVSLEPVTAWRRGKIILQNEALSEACVRMNRYSRIKIHVQDKAVASLGVSGVFEAGDTGAFVEALESLFGIKALRIGNDSILLARAE
jgi:transmembrane sensor